MRNILKFVNGEWILRCVSDDGEKEYRGKTVADVVSKCGGMASLKMA